jgi:phospholipase C
MQKTRREFLNLSAHAMGAVTAARLIYPSIARALDVPAHTATHSIMDVQHVVILMQENRSFDHYFGSLRGVRGFGDRIPFPLPDGDGVWAQKDREGKAIHPFHMSTQSTSAQKVPDLAHSWESAQGAFNNGKYDRWIAYKSPLTMAHYRREDVPFQYALADAFTLCDAYHCSIPGCTSPNRIFFWAGGNDPKAAHGGPVISNESSCSLDTSLNIPGAEGYGHGPRYTFTTYPERLERAGISWRIYQDPKNNFIGLMNACVAFQQFNEAPKGSALCDQGMSQWTLDDLKRDVSSGTLPQVSWVCPSQEQSEHPGGSSPVQGGSFTQQVLDALTSNPEVWSKTVLFITFDENDGFFDHMPPPSPPPYRADGSSAGISTVDVADEYQDSARVTPEAGLMAKASHVYSMGIPDKLLLENAPARIPYGMSARVPMYVISPWSRGGWVNSQVFDHTSVIRFLEKRFGVMEPNITPWRRAVSGDLTSAFDFQDPNLSRFPQLPGTLPSEARRIAETQQKLPVPAPPAENQQLWQEAGVRPSRALPYDLAVEEMEARQPDGFRLRMKTANVGTSGVAAVFYVYDKRNLAAGPRIYTVEDGKSITDEWTLSGQEYDFWIYGPNGFLRVFKGERQASGSPAVTVTRAGNRSSIVVSISKHGDSPSQLIFENNAHGSRPLPFTLAPGERKTLPLALSEHGNWYDFRVRQPQSTFERRFAGRMENGHHSISDPQLA